MHIVCVQYQLKMKDKDNHDVEQDVTTDTNVVQYHVVKDGVEAWILQDFDKVVFRRSCLLKSFSLLRNMNKYVRPPNTQTKMYAGRIACCPLVSHVEYAPRVLLTLDG